MATIHEAARAGDLVGLLSILEADASVLNSRDRHSRTPLHLASWAGHADVVHTLCKKHADVGATAVDNMAAIHFASQKGHVEVVRQLLAAGASVSSCTRKGMTPLHYAIQGRHLDVAKFLIKKGASLYSVNKAGKKAIDLAKDDEFVSDLQAAEKLNQAVKSRHESKSEESKASSKAGTMLDSSGIDYKDESLQVPVLHADKSPPRKKSKVQLSHLGMDNECDSVSDEIN